MAGMKELDFNLVTTGSPVEGGAVWTSFAESPELPVDATSKMSEMTGWESCGELSDDGLKTGRDTKSTDLHGWHGSTLLSEQDGATSTVDVSFVEVERGTAAKLRYGKANVEVDADGVVTQATERAYAFNDTVPLVFDELESNGRLHRTVYPKCKVTKFDDEDHKKGSLRVYGMTFTALDPGTGVVRYEYYAKPATGGTTPSGK